MRLLLVDDEERMVAALRRGLTAGASWSRARRTAYAGLALAQEGDFDAMVLDVMLPGLSGYEVVRRLRAAGNWIPVLMLSAKDGEYDEADALDDGADDYLTKPFLGDEIGGRVVGVHDHQWIASRSEIVAPSEKCAVRMPEPGTLSASLSVILSSASSLPSSIAW